MDERIESVLGFWLAGDEKARAQRWFAKSPALDAEIHERFGAEIEAALRGELGAWAERSPRGALALLVLLDQFPRNVFRGSPRSFEGDATALLVSNALRASGGDRALGIDERALALLPTMHAEDLATQREGLAAYRTLLADTTTDAERAQVANNVDFAEQHLKIIERFGRFPHRNDVLGRASTDEERAFLEQPGSSF
jgi:uncharacterized protein (DUF924 family)